MNFVMNAKNTKYISVKVANEDLTGCTVKFKLGSILKTSATISGDTLTVKIDPSDTENLSGNHKYEVQLTDLEGNVSTLVHGIATIKQSIF